MEKRKPQEVEACEPDDEDLESLELDIDDTLVQVTDGVIVGGDDEEIKMLFFYKTPLQDRCKGVVEFRTSKTRFLEITREVNKMAKMIKGYEDGINPMFI
jgi:hypothetical protein